MLRIINKTLFVAFADLISLGVPENTIKQGCARQLACWQKISDPEDKRKALIQYETLKDQYKELINKKYADPYEYIRKNGIQSHIVTDIKAVEFYRNHKLADGSNLKKEYADKYTSAAQWLNLIVKANAGGRTFLEELGMTSYSEFYTTITHLITVNDIDLPANYAKLKAKLRAYQAEGYQALISKKFLNDNSKKVKDEVSEALLLKMLAHPNGFDFNYVSAQYNVWALKQGCKTITGSTVRNYYYANELQVKAERDGVKAWRDKFDKVIHRDRPSVPLLLINSDDNNLDLYFQRERTNGKGHTQKDYYYRFVLYVVVDAYNDYPLGYAWGDQPSKELVKAAYLDAVHHVKQLTGEQVLWHQILTDNWGLKSEDLRSFYENQAMFAPAKFANARAKVIEASFGKRWHNVLRTYPNYAGHNVKAEKQLNSENIEKIKKDFPHIDEAPAQIQDFFNKIRHYRKDGESPSLQEQWLAGYTTMPADKKRELTDADRLMLFGHKHTSENRITKEGLMPTLNGKKLVYEVPEADYLKHVGLQTSIMYDPYDMSKILAVGDDGRVRIECNLFQKQKMAFMDMGEGDRASLNALLTEKKRISQGVLDASNYRNDLLDRAELDAESILQAGVLVKEIKNAAERKVLGSGSVEEEEFDPSSLM